MASLATRRLANRAVHLRITPRPSNLGESGEVLRLISQFGEVEYFKHLKYDRLSAPTTVLVIFKDDDAAQQCLYRSPVRFRMDRAPVVEQSSESQGKVSQMDGPHSESTAEGAETEQAAQTRESIASSSHSSASQPLLDSRIFQIQSNPARVRFRDQIDAGAYHGGFALDTKSVAQQDLAKSVPAIGLSCVDWRAGEKPWRVVQKEKVAEQRGPRRRKSLRELFDEGAQERSTD